MRQKIIVGLILGVLFLLLISLGVWQMNRAEEKRALAAQIAAAQQLPVAPLDLYQSLSKQIYRRLTVTGRFDGAHQFIYDNQTYKGRSGYFVLTPLHLANSGDALLVNRGFMPWRYPRALDDISIDNNLRTIVISLQIPKLRPRLSQLDATTTYPLLIDRIDLSDLSQLSGFNLLPVVGLLDKDAEDGFIRAWQPFYGSVDKHLAYALQWFAMAAVVALIGGHLYWKSRG